MEKKYLDRILFISGNFFGYSQRIVSRMNAMGNKIDFLCIKQTLFERTLRSLNKNVYERFYYIKLTLLLIVKYNFNYKKVIFLNSDILPSSFFYKLKQKNPKSFFILYIWDDMENLNFNIDIQKYFHKIFSYNADQSLKFNFTYKPFFYSHKIVLEKEFKISFVGTVHSNRYEVIKMIETNLTDTSINTYLYLNRFTFLKYIKKHFNIFRMIHFKHIPYNKYIDVLAKSICTLEIPHKNQKNITTRAIEVVGTETKLITTSKAIKQLDFYDPDNVYIIEDLDNINYRLLEKWLNIPYKKIDANLLEKYYIDNWINHLLYSMDN